MRQMVLWRHSIYLMRMPDVDLKSIICIIAENKKHYDNEVFHAINSYHNILG